MNNAYLRSISNDLWSLDIRKHHKKKCCWCKIDDSHYMYPKSSLFVYCSCNCANKYHLKYDIETVRLAVFVNLYITELIYVKDVVNLIVKFSYILNKRNLPHKECTYCKDVKLDHHFVNNLCFCSKRCRYAYFVGTLGWSERKCKNLKSW
jgi:hypothetical protein